MEKFRLQFFIERKQAGKNLRMVINWKYYLKNAAITGIHAHISLWNGIWKLA
jgi:hypothetical protein